MEFARCSQAPPCCCYWFVNIFVVSLVCLFVSGLVVFDCFCFSSCYAISCVNVVIYVYIICLYIKRELLGMLRLVISPLFRNTYLLLADIHGSENLDGGNSALVMRF